MLGHDEVLKDILELFPGQEEIPETWDSLKHLELITHFENKYKLRFTIEEVINSHNHLERIIELILKKKS